MTSELIPDYPVLGDRNTRRFQAKLFSSCPSSLLYQSNPVGNFILPVGNFILPVGNFILPVGNFILPEHNQQYPVHPYSTVTDFARFLGWSTSHPLATAAG